MITDAVLMQNHELRRQAMLRAMQMEVWLPRQQLVHAARSRDDLLEWCTVETAPIVRVPPVVKAVTSQVRAVSVADSAAIKIPSLSPPPRYGARDSLRDKLALVATPLVEATPAATAVLAVEPPVLQVEPMPHFALQVLRADNCLIVVDLLTGEPFQSRDPDFQLLKDMLRAAGLTDQPEFLRQGTPIIWPMLQSGQLMHTQHATAARACVRDVLSFELETAPAACIWLVGEQAVRFANADHAALYEVQPFLEGAPLWSLPSLESILEQPLLKRDIWRSMCAVRSLWQVQNDE